jgi:hypothetical protein
MSILNRIQKWFVTRDKQRFDTIIAEARAIVNDWSESHPTHVSTNALVATMEGTIRQLRFLLDQAPMIDAPTGEDGECRARLRASSSNFAYVHPKTLSRWVETPATTVLKFPGSKTKYVLTSLMPEGRIIYSQTALPGIEKLLEQK